MQHPLSDHLPHEISGKKHDLDRGEHLIMEGIC